MNIYDKMYRMNPQEILQKYYGYQSFRKGQKEVIHSILDGKNAVVVMPTGGGKSLCYQIPALCLPGVTIVISPLIALMKDQVDRLISLNVPATFINSSLSPVEIESRMLGLAMGQYKIVYVAPERFNDPDMVTRFKGLNVSLIAIDEAHCVSEWGHDFRPSYLRIKNVIKQFGHPRVVALTATATPEVRDDIIKQLGLLDYELYITGFDRPNLDFQVELGSKQEKLYTLLEFVKNAPSPGIIYAGTRNTADEISEILNVHDISAVNYHAGLDAFERDKIQDEFMNGRYSVIVATNAFGMGIDKADIRFVIHYDIPGTIEAYYQEAGRAGRDGHPATCLLLYNPSDRYLREFFLKGDNPSRENIEEIYKTICEFPEEPVLMTYSEIQQSLSDKVPDMAIGTALKLLERAGYIEMRGERQKEAFIQFKVNITELVGVIGNRAKTKLAVVDHLYSTFDRDIMHGVNLQLESHIESSEIKKDAYMRVLRDLHKSEVITFEPPFRGKEIYIKKRVEPHKLELDWVALANKLDRDMEKLNQMEGYVYYSGRKKDYILRYFGERI